MTHSDPRLVAALAALSRVTESGFILPVSAQAMSPFTMTVVLNRPVVVTSQSR